MSCVSLLFIAFSYLSYSRVIPHTRSLLLTVPSWSSCQDLEAKCAIPLLRQAFYPALRFSSGFDGMPPAIASAQAAYHPAPHPGSAHSTGGRADGPGAIMFYASMSLLGFSVIFVIWYYAVKAVKEGQKQRRAKARRGRGGSLRAEQVES